MGCSSDVNEVLHRRLGVEAFCCETKTEVVFEMVNVEDTNNWNRLQLLESEALQQQQLVQL